MKKVSFIQDKINDILPVKERTNPPFLKVQDKVDFSLKASSPDIANIPDKTFLAQIQASRPAIEVSSSFAVLDFKTVQSELKEKTRLENAKLGLRILANYYKRLGNCRLYQIIKDKIDSPALAGRVPDEPFLDVIKRQLKPEIERKLVDWEGAREVLKGKFYKQYNGELEFNGFEAESVEMPQNSSTRDARKPSSGFDREVLEFNPALKHSMANLDEYIENRLGSFLIEDIIKNKRIIELHPGDETQALSSLSSRGFTKLIRIFTPRSQNFNRIYLAQNNEGQLMYVVTRLAHGDRLRHYQLMLRLASYKGAFIDSSQIRIYRGPAAGALRSYRGYNSAILDHQIKPDKVIIGFKGTIKDQFKNRHLSAERAETLKKLGHDPLAKILKEIKVYEGSLEDPDKEKLNSMALSLKEDESLSDVLKLSREDVFARYKNAEKIEEIYKIINKISAEFPSFEFLKILLADLKVPDNMEISKAGRSYFSDQCYLTYIDKEGNHKILLLVRNPYGDLAESLGYALNDWKIEDVLVIGTAGGLEDDDEIGRVKFPFEFYNAFDQNAGFKENELLNFVKQSSADKKFSSGPRLQSRLRKVRSPLEETCQLINEFKAKGYDLVEMEAPDLIKALSRNPEVRFGSAYIVSDMPSTPHTLEAHFVDDKMNKSINEITDTIIDYYNIKEVLPFLPQAKDLSAFQKAFSLSERLMESGIIDSHDKELMKYNLARYFINGTTNETLDWLYQHWDGKAEELSGRLGGRWMSKLQREIRSPYTNQKVIGNLSALERRLQKLVAFIKEKNHNSSPYKLYLFGSIAKGRFGSSSDLDVVIKTKDKDLLECVLSSEFGYKGSNDKSFTVGDFYYVANRMDFYRPALSIGRGEGVLTDPDFLKKCYFKKAENYGLIIKQSGGKINVMMKEEALSQVTREVPIVAEKMLEYEKHFRSFMNTDFILKYLKNPSEIKEITSIPLERLIGFGGELIKGYISAYFSMQTLKDFLKTSRGKSFLSKISISEDQFIDRLENKKDVFLLNDLDLEDILDIIKINDPVERIAVLFAAAEARKANPLLAEMKEALRACES